jgi:hypothetical protein
MITFLHALRLLCFAEAAGTDASKSQAVQHGQVPQLLNLKWYLSGFVGRICATLRIGHFQIHSFFKSNSS